MKDQDSYQAGQFTRISQLLQETTATIPVNPSAHKRVNLHEFLSCYGRLGMSQTTQLNSPKTLVIWHQQILSLNLILSWKPKILR